MAVKFGRLHNFSGGGRLRREEPGRSQRRRMSRRAQHAKRVSGIDDAGGPELLSGRAAYQLAEMDRLNKGNRQEDGGADYAYESLRATFPAVHSPALNEFYIIRQYCGALGFGPGRSENRLPPLVADSASAYDLSLRMRLTSRRPRRIAMIRIGFASGS